MRVSIIFFKPQRSPSSFINSFSIYCLLVVSMVSIGSKLLAQQEDSLTNQGKKQLEGYFYKEIIENADSSIKGMPLIIALHWMRSTPDEFSSYVSGFNKPVRILLVEGSYPYMEGFSFYPVDPENYYRMAADNRMKVLLEESEKLSKFVEAATQLYTPGIKPVIIGASQGGDLSYVMAIRFNHLISLSCPLLATIDNRIIVPAKEKHKSLAPIVAFHGEEDPIVNVVTAKNHIKLLEKNGYRASLFTYKNVKHEIAASMKADYINLINKNLKLPPEKTAAR